MTISSSLIEFWTTLLTTRAIKNNNEESIVFQRKKRNGVANSINSLAEWPSSRREYSHSVYLHKYGPLFFLEARGDEEYGHPACNSEKSEGTYRVNLNASSDSRLTSHEQRVLFSASTRSPQRRI